MRRGQIALSAYEYDLLRVLTTGANKPELGNLAARLGTTPSEFPALVSVDEEEVESLLDLLPAKPTREVEGLRSLLINWWQQTVQ